MKIGHFYYSELHNIYFIPIAFFTGDYYKGISVMVNEYGYNKIEGCAQNFKDTNFKEITKEAFFKNTKIAIDFIKNNLLQ